MEQGGAATAAGHLRHAQRRCHPAWRGEGLTATRPNERARPTCKIAHPAHARTHAPPACVPHPFASIPARLRPRRQQLLDCPLPHACATHHPHSSLPCPLHVPLHPTACGKAELCNSSEMVGTKACEATPVSHKGLREQYGLLTKVSAVTGWVTG